MFPANYVLRTADCRHVEEQQLNNVCESVSDPVKVKVKQSRYRPGVAQRVPGN
jgi:hypothetical protein